MKSEYKFIVFCLLLCSVPAIVFFMFRDKNDSLGAYSKPQSTTWPLVLQDTDYTAKLDVSNPPLKRGKQHLKLRFETGAALAHLSPVVKITMPMGKNSMEAPVILTKQTQPGQYDIQTDFPMAGNWEIRINETKTTQNPLKGQFLVEL